MKYLTWVDLETTGLDPEVDDILEIGMVLTDQNYTILAEESVVISIGIDRLKYQFQRCEEVVCDMHIYNGLWHEVSEAEDDINVVMSKLYGMMQLWYPNGEKPAMCGNSLTHDRIFLRKYMPALDGLFHYRNYDMSSVREFMRDQFPETEAHEPPRNSSNRKHRVIDDIHDSILLAKYYSRCIYLDPSIEYGIPHAEPGWVY